MNCPSCGSVLKDGLAFCTQCGAPRPVHPQSTSPRIPVQQRQAPVEPFRQSSLHPQELPVQPHPQQTLLHPQQSVRQADFMSKAKPRSPKSGGNVWIRVASVFLCILLTVSLLATALLLDLRTITDPERLTRTLEATLIPAGAVVRPLAVGGFDQEIEIAPDATADDLVNLVYDALEEYYGDDLEITRGQLKRFYDKSTLPQRLSEMISGYVTDLLNGTQDTQITEDDVMDIIQENEQLIESSFDVRVRDGLVREVLRFIDVEELNENIRQSVVEEISNTAVGGATLGDLLRTLNGFAADDVLWVMIGINVLLIAALMLINWGRFAVGLRCVAIGVLGVGVLLALPSILVPILMGGNSLVNVLVRTLLSSMALVHFGTLALGVVLLTVSIVLSVVMGKKR